MSEERFEFFKDGDKIYCRDVFDDFNYPMYDESTAKDIVNFMNYLYDEKKEVSKNFYRFYKEDYCNLEKENKQLKTANEGLFKDLNRIVEDHQCLQNKFQKLKKENEQLEQKYRKLQIDFNNACGVVYDLRESKLDLEDENEQLKKQLDDNLQFLIRASERLGFESLDHLLYTLDKGEITGYSTANWEKGDVE